MSIKNEKSEFYIFQHNEQSVELHYSDLREIILILRAVEHPLRKKIIKLLWMNKKMTVTEVYIKLRIEQSVASQHLAILRRSGIVVANRNGKYINYSLNQNQLQEIAKLVEQLTYKNV